MATTTKSLNERIALSADAKCVINRRQYVLLHFQYIRSVLRLFSRYITIVCQVLYISIIRYSLHNCAEKSSSIHDQQIHKNIDVYALRVRKQN